MTNKEPQKDIEIPKCNAELRKLIKKLVGEELKKLNKDQLQKFYDRAKEAYPDTGGGQISRNERENLYIIQEGLFGSIDPKLQASLENIGETLVKKPEKRKKAIDYKLPNSGAVIIKHWKGKQLEVKIVDSSFEYDGESYKSLSKLAKEITGYGVSGPIFFGLRKPKTRVSGT